MLTANKIAVGIDRRMKPRRISQEPSRTIFEWG